MNTQETLLDIYGPEGLEDMAYPSVSIGVNYAEYMEWVDMILDAEAEANYDRIMTDFVLSHG